MCYFQLDTLIILKANEFWIKTCSFFSRQLFLLLVTVSVAYVFAQDDDEPLVAAASAGKGAVAGGGAAFKAGKAAVSSSYHDITLFEYFV